MTAKKPAKEKQTVGAGDIGSIEEVLSKDAQEEAKDSEKGVSDGPPEPSLSIEEDLDPEAAEVAGQEEPPEILPKDQSIKATKPEKKLATPVQELENLYSQLKKNQLRFAKETDFEKVPGSFHRYLRDLGKTLNNLALDIQRIKENS